MQMFDQICKIFYRKHGDLLQMHAAMRGISWYGRAGKTKRPTRESWPFAKTGGESGTRTPDLRIMIPQIT